MMNYEQIADFHDETMTYVKAVFDLMKNELHLEFDNCNSKEDCLVFSGKSGYKYVFDSISEIMEFIIEHNVSSDTLLDYGVISIYKYDELEQKRAMEEYEYFDEE